MTSGLLPGNWIQYPENCHQKHNRRTNSDTKHYLKYKI
jgi:hypothetical protein